MPQFLKCLGEVVKDHSTQLQPLESFSDLMKDKLRLVDITVASSEAKLIIGNDC